MIDPAKHVSQIARQLSFLATHRGGCRREETDTIAALAQIAKELRSAAAVFEREREEDSGALKAALKGAPKGCLIGVGQDFDYVQPRASR